MARKQDLTGQVFGRLTVVEENDAIGGAGVYWWCRCECGNEKLVRAGNLKSGQVRSCGCLHRDTVAVIDMVGKRFGRLVVLERAGSLRDSAMWKCLCDCGNEAVVEGTNLRSKNTKSCGCQRSDSAKLTNRKHGMQAATEYKRWENAKQRCFNPKNPSYVNYGARGITMCDEWRNDFEAFYQHVGPCPGEGFSLDRINNDGNYEPGNVRWSNAHEQMKNRRPMRKITQAQYAVLERENERLRALLDAQ